MRSKDELIGWYVHWDQQFSWGIEYAESGSVLSDNDLNWVGPYSTFKDAKKSLLEGINHDISACQMAKDEVRFLTEKQVNRRVGLIG